MTRQEVLHVDLWGKHATKWYGGCQSLVMFIGDKSQTRWGVPFKRKDEAAEAPLMVIQDVAGPEGICIGRMKCDGAAEFKGRFQSLCQQFGITTEANALHIPQGNAIAERGFGYVIGAARSLFLESSHLPVELWTEAVKAEIYIKNRMPTDVLNGMAPREVWQGKELASLKHTHEWGSLGFKHTEAHSRPNKLATRAKKLHLDGYGTKQKTYRLWDTGEPFKITNSAEVSWTSPKKGMLGFPSHARYFNPEIKLSKYKTNKKINHSMDP